MARLLVLLVLTGIVDSSFVKPCRHYVNKVTCRGNISKYLTKNYLTRQTSFINILEFKNTDISSLEGEWTEGIINLTQLVINFNDNLNNLSRDSLKNFKNLSHLDLKNNNISFLDNIAFHPMINLEYLNLGYNKLHQMQTGVFSTQQRLKILYLNNNMIKEVNSVALNSLLNLEELYLQENGLVKLDGRCFMSLEKLRILNLGKNDLRQLSVTLFQYQIHLKELHLDENNFTEIKPLLLSHLDHIQYLNFRNNNIQTLDLGILKKLSDLRILDMSECHISCDCSAKIFYQYCNERSIHLDLTCKLSKSGTYINGSDYLPQMDCSIVDKPRLELLIILGLLFISLLVDIFVSWMNYKYDLSTHRALSTESVNEYEYVDNFKDLEEKAYKISGVRDSGRYQSVLQKVISVYEYLRPLPGRRIHDDYYNTGSNPPIPLQTAPPIPPSNSYDISN